MATFDIPPIHGRGSYRADLQISTTLANVDLTGETIFLEIPSAGLRVLLPVDPNNPGSKLIAISRTVVESLPTSPSQYAVIDETDPVYPNVLLNGLISRNGYIGAPS